MANIMTVAIGKGLELDVDLDALPENSVKHALYIGLRNILMDAHANGTEAKYGEEAIAVSRAMSEKKLAVLYSGGTRVITERETDPVRAAMLDWAERADYAEWKKAAAKGDKYTNARKRAALYLEQHPDQASEWQKAAEMVFGK